MASTLFVTGQPERGSSLVSKLPDWKSFNQFCDTNSTTKEILLVHFTYEIPKNFFGGDVKPKVLDVVAMVVTVVSSSHAHWADVGGLKSKGAY
ncbi:hypothetical protein EVAR_43767_1 [Eumeta japonica]|uniref:Uncharacterized protein n=1 Tax=Eumeta variegata TaxID=151549 RepID=A0A4C1XL59_EUMVA|nr:hypothetical protein EVAR_43767_1 [Eumeta japonica]